MGPHYIKDNCMTCATCIKVCPLTAISYQEESCVVNADLCVDCGSCEEVCPLDAITWQ